MSILNIEKIRADFPILQTKIRDKNLIYLDNAATTQKPLSVIESINHYYKTSNANIHRGVHALSEAATEKFEKVRDKVKDFIQAAGREEIIFVKGTTEAINMTAQSFVKPLLKPNDNIIISTMEHHSNIVPWQIVCEQTGAQLKIIPINNQGEIIIEDFIKLLSPQTKFISLVHISNSLGTINPVEKIISIAHKHNIPVLLDGAQSIQHLEINVQQLDCDFFAFSGHKMYGPTGIGVLYGKQIHLENMLPYQGGGDMIRQVTFEKTTYNSLPYKFEAGTPNIAGVIGLGAAIDYLKKTDLNLIRNYEKKLLDYATQKIQSDYADSIQIIGTAAEKASILSFIFKDIHAHDIGTILDQEGIAVRTGHHCCMPLMTRFNISATTRASFAFYNTLKEIDIFISALGGIKKIFSL